MNKFCVSIIALLVLSSCDTSNPQHREKEKEQNKTYSKTANNLDVDMFLYHVDSVNSQLYYSINNSQLIYKKTDTTGNFSTRIKVFYKLLPYADAKTFFDTATVYINDKTEGEPQAKILSGYIPLKINIAQPIYIELHISDVNGNKHQTHFIKCDKTTAFSQQNYLLTDANNQVFFSNKIERENNIRIYNTRTTFNKARVDFFTNDYSLPPPPFSSRAVAPYPSVPDSTFYINSTGEHSLSLQIARQGVYYIRLDTVQNQGCVVMGVEKNFPKVLSHTQMIAATRFIMSKDEYQKMTSASDKQQAIDKFWLTLGGGEDRAKELIKRYYNRVQDANTFFTSHIEGWKTDMGMIYIIFGPPNTTYKTQQMETWVYGNEGTPNSATFKFEKINNPFSENNFKLIRNESYKDAWYIAVNNWRDGHVYLDTK